MRTAISFERLGRSLRPPPSCRMSMSKSVGGFPPFPPRLPWRRARCLARRADHAGTDEAAARARETER
eukprot:9143931-Pyramimonas_sp.AAC.1